MARWLFKEEPSHYSYADLERDGETDWNGVSNNLALQNLRKIRRKDRVLFYHTGSEKAVVGMMEVVADPEPDPDDPTKKLVVVRVKAVRRLRHPVPLSRIKADPQLSGWDLVRLSRLSVVSVSEEQWRRVEELSRESVSEE
jgi:predicted RNA-binding protein with PUA-like domain